MCGMPIKNVFFKHICRHLETSPSLQVIHNKLFSPLDYTTEMAARSYSNLLPLALL